ncbi:MAG: glycosyltransferase [Hespellia sp.]|nr:glycosyltransferase [Hespellia sp.]
MKKILIYNWIPFDETENKGGGVTIYTKNLISCLIQQGKWKVYFLSSGRAYDNRRREPYIEQTKNIFGKGCQSFQVVNSPVFSSARISFPFPQDYLEDMKLVKLLRGFLMELGGVDVLHFQNFEGLSLRVFILKTYFPKMKVIYSLHNYYLFCPQVMLWHADRENCRVRCCGNQCLDCMPRDVYKGKVRFNQNYQYRLEQGNLGWNKWFWLFGKRSLEVWAVWRGWFRETIATFRKSYLQKYEVCRRSVFQKRREKAKYFVSVKREKRLSACFYEFGSRNVAYLNRYVDQVLAVSERVAQIARERGVHQEKLRVSYIGTAVAANQRSQSAYRCDGTRLTICYLGYMRTMKGFYFLLDALEQMEPEMAGRIGLCVASPATDQEAYDRIQRLREHLAEVRYYDGYTHEQLPEILQGVHLGIVPSLWEDNLPQVAMEMKSYGVPVLSSQLGGAKELTESEWFVFEAGNQKEFLERLGYFLQDPGRLDDYWKGDHRLLTMEEHFRELEQIYEDKWKCKQ